MRKLLGMAMFLGLVVAGGLAKDASAGATIDLVFVELNGLPILATDTVTLLPGGGDTLKMNIVMRTSESLSGHAFSINYDLDGDNELDVLHRGNWTGVTINAKATVFYAPIAGAFSPTTPTFVGSWNSTNGANTSTFMPANPGGYTIGTVVWTVGAGVNTDGQDIIIGFLNPGVDGLGGAAFANISASALFKGATVNVIPEPGTAALVGFGLVGLILAGRRNRA